MTKTEIVNRLKTALKDNLNFSEADIEKLNENSDLLKELGMSSIDALQLLVVVEREFSIMIDDEEFSAELLQSLNNLSEFVLKKVS